MTDAEKFLADLICYGTAVRTMDGKHVSYHDFRLSDEELEAKQRAGRHTPEGNAL